MVSIFRNKGYINILRKKIMVMNPHMQEIKP